jgi:signal transduction histidine kinase
VKEEQRLAQIERLVSLGTLASGFSHEVNTPLATILTCAESVLDRLDGATGERASDGTLPAVRDSAIIIRDQVLRCRHITQQFLRFSRGIPPSIEPIDLREVVAGVIALVASAAREKGIELRLAPEQRLPPVRANSEVVQHVVLNLLVNAVQSFKGKNGAVELSFRTGDDVRLRVRDEGCGIASEHKTHLFEPFHSRKPGGTGLGLFLSRSFMRLPRPRFGTSWEPRDWRISSWAGSPSMSSCEHSSTRGPTAGASPSSRSRSGTW